MERELFIEWGMTVLLLGAIVALATFSIWAILQALKPVEQPEPVVMEPAYDVVAEASRIAMRRWYRRDMEVS
jgi:hypothetical protein